MDCDVQLAAQLCMQPSKLGQTDLECLVSDQSSPVCLCVQGYKFPRVAVMISVTLVNT